jgi:hypothetical protein
MIAILCFICISKQLKHDKIVINLKCGVIQKLYNHLLAVKIKHVK